ncbi:CST complex subunit STN1-like [Dysidea avara]|uniref:CST complex subunit STN1-like n=1 Tax=Dysidea avara TaxID=196820 RepID=UPI00332DF11F
MEFYPPKYWGLDPVYFACVKLTIADVLNLREHPLSKGTYCIHNHPISKVCVMGDVVLIDRRHNFIGYGVDDSSGVIQCYQWCDEEQHSLEFSLGQLVMVIGRITVFRDERQIQVDTMIQQSDPNSEVLHWLEVRQLKNTLYAQPFVIPFNLLPSSSGEQPSTKANPTEVTCDVLLDHFKQSVVSFTLPEVLTDEKLLQVLSDTLKDKLGDSYERGVIPFDQLVRLSVAHLVEQGQMIANHHVSSSDQLTTYELFSPNRHLKPAILLIIHDQSPSCPSGVHADHIVQTLRLQQHLSYIPRDVMKSTVRSLEDSSDIYETASNCYKIVG